MFDVGGGGDDAPKAATNGALEKDDPILEMMELEKAEKTGK